MTSFKSLDVSTSTPATQIYKDKFVFDTDTGELFSHYHIYPYISEDHPEATLPRGSTSAYGRYLDWKDVLVSPEGSQGLEDDCGRVLEHLANTPELHEEDATPSTTPKKGRPKTITHNPIADYMPLLHMNGCSWVDDIVFGSVLTSVGSSNGKANCSIATVYACLYLEHLSTVTVKGQGDSKRKAEYVVKAARHAAHGIYSYLIRHPKLFASLQAEADIERQLMYKP